MRIKPTLAGFVAGSIVTASLMLSLGAAGHGHAVGRYQIAGGEHGFVLDTVTGQAWGSHLSDFYKPKVQLPAEAPQ